MINLSAWSTLVLSQWSIKPEKKIKPEKEVSSSAHDFIVFFLHLIFYKKKTYQTNVKLCVRKNIFSVWTVKFAEICKICNLSKHTPYGKQALSFKLISNSSISKETKLKASRQSNMSMHVTYQRLTDENHNKRYITMNPALTREVVNKQQDNKHFCQPLQSSQPPDIINQSINQSINFIYSNQNQPFYSPYPYPSPPPLPLPMVYYHPVPYYPMPQPPY